MPNAVPSPDQVPDLSMMDLAALVALERQIVQAIGERLVQAGPLPVSARVESAAYVNVLRNTTTNLEKTVRGEHARL